MSETASLIECEAAPAFWECEWRGTPLDAEVLYPASPRTTSERATSCTRRYPRPGWSPTEGDGSQKAIAIGLTRYLDARGLIVRDSVGRPINTLFRWERKRVDGRVETRRDLNFTPDAIPRKPRKPTKGKAPVKRAGQPPRKPGRRATRAAWRSTPRSLSAGKRRWQSQSGSFGLRWAKPPWPLRQRSDRLGAHGSPLLPQHAGGRWKSA